MYLNYLTGREPLFITLGLTLTWDVFKCKKKVNTFKELLRLTLTWDVFK